MPASAPAGAAQDRARRAQFPVGVHGRLAAVLGADKPITFTDQLPLCFHGGPVAPDIALGTAAAKPPLDARQQHLIEAMYRGQHASGVDLETAVDEGFAVRQEVFQSIQAEMEQAGRGAMTAKPRISNCPPGGSAG